MKRSGGRGPITTHFNDTGESEAQNLDQGSAQQRGEAGWDEPTHLHETVLEIRWPPST